MNAAQQHMLDVYRSAQLGTPAPPAPGTGDVEAYRSFRTWRAFQGVVDERVAARRARRAALLRPLRAVFFRRPAAAAVRPYTAQDTTRRVPDTCGRPAEC
ncbi:hypothetical protein GO001_15140 [Streptomyces sp. NRRL B-1677]|uniref:Uncharacterized protein n=1 Tax=Streptomyces klenkii TaxID=1420899 RepID=A0A3B0BMJ6_9ACTN|nr:MULTISPECIES: hypothetical protein [Streptomyces]MBF6046547.1 hypothetical protein [Streptomyces sp. NRRL B-1677]RKN74733.1 hypothetical protein D7231_13025 [Streptomyces klenkii]